MVSANSSTSAGGLASAAIGMRPTRNGASQAMTLRSACTRRATDGRCTLTTTRSPVRSVAACTWAMEAAARGVRSNWANTASSGRPSSASTTARTWSHGSARHLVAALLELGDQLLGEQALAAGDDLAELDVGRAEVLGRDAQPPGDVGPRRRATARAGRRAPTRRRPGRGGGPPGRPGARRAGGGAGSARGPRGGRPSGRASTERRHVMASGSTSQGGSSLNDPMARSAEFGEVRPRVGRASEQRSWWGESTVAPVLHDYRVIELGMWVAGPGAGGVLADWGADVVKVETPRRRPDAAAVPAARRPRPARVAAVRPRQPGQAQRRGRPGHPRGRRDRAAAAGATPTCSSPTSAPRRSSGWASAPTSCWPSSPASSTPA